MRFTLRPFYFVATKYEGCGHRHTTRHAALRCFDKLNGNGVAIYRHSGIYRVAGKEKANA